jgi:8-oxo-dGTP diphosphatase
MRLDDIDWSKWTPAEEATLLYVIRDGKVLLIHKKRGLGAGKVNAPGGRVQQGETPREAAIREFEEELRVTPVGVVEVGEVLFHQLDATAIRIHVFSASNCIGEPRATEEAVPFWVPVDRVPFGRMWEADRHWLPLLLRGESFQARTLFDGDALLGFDIGLRYPGRQPGQDA